MLRAARRLLAAATALTLAGCASAPAPARPTEPSGGRVVFDTVRSAVLARNPQGDPMAREVAVYLPPGYDDGAGRRYPVVYLLHGFDGDARQFLAPRFALPRGLDSLILAGTLPPMLVAMPDGRDALGGSFWADSPTGGRWEEHLVAEVVGHLDATYRTLPRPSSRGVAGWSMGGHAALRVAMRHPDRFGAVYALSPCCLGPSLAADFPAPLDPTSFGGRLLRAAARAGADATPAERVAAHLPALQQLRAIGFDAGRADALTHIPRSAAALSDALAAADVTHRWEVYEGGHGDRVPERLRRVALPFLGRALRE